jgi:hypothetical protein
MLIKGSKTNYFSTSGLFYSVKNGRYHTWEGALELAYMHCLELDPEVARFQEQPVAIHYVDQNGRATRYTPDVLVHYVCDPGTPDRPSQLCEIKPQRVLEEQRAKFAHRFRVARAYAAKNGCVFRILHEEHIRTPNLRNAQLLVPHLKLAPNEELAHSLLTTLDTVGPTSAVALVAHVEPDPDKRATVYTELWRLVASHRIAADLKKQLTGHSTVWLP